jgi:predicted nucleotidyltransferase
MDAAVSNIDPAALARFCHRWMINELALFGSTARGEARPDSDVDLLVTFSAAAPWSLFDMVRMRDELSGMFGRDVDLVEEAAINNPFRRRSILRDKRVLYAA